MIEIAKNSVIGQQKVKQDLSKILESNRLGHAYLFAGPPGSGKKALALAFAEAVNGIQNLSALGESAYSSKSTWLNHPDIHFFIPIPKNVSHTELRERIIMLSEDPYAIVDFANRPGSSSESDSKNKKAFYFIDYFRDDIRPSFFLRPNEGKRNIILLANIETMQTPVSNAFLKVLEEPPEDVLIIMTTDQMNTILPTVLSRCQILKCNGLSNDELAEGLIQKDGLTKDDAEYMARVSGGNYALARYFDIKQIKEVRSEIMTFLRMSYLQDASEISALVNKWSSDYNIEGMITLLNMFEVLLKDIMIFMHTGDETLLVNIDQADTISRFVKSLKDAKIDEMLAQIEPARIYIRQNVQPKYILTVLSIRLGYLMRGFNTIIPAGDKHQHLPAFEY